MLVSFPPLSIEWWAVRPWLNEEKGLHLPPTKVKTYLFSTLTLLIFPPFLHPSHFLGKKVERHSMPKGWIQLIINLLQEHSNNNKLQDRQKSRKLEGTISCGLLFLCPPCTILGANSCFKWSLGSACWRTSDSLASTHFKVQTCITNTGSHWRDDIQEVVNEIYAHNQRHNNSATNNSSLALIVLKWKMDVRKMCSNEVWKLCAHFPIVRCIYHHSSPI